MLCAHVEGDDRERHLRGRGRRGGRGAQWRRRARPLCPAQLPGAC
uniref:Uncharacterized protein n=1 Tax=Oryza nivara TaxID=4536 RepID=A0A0E0IGM9_ORYNI